METVIPLPTMAFITPWESLSISGVRGDGNMLPSGMGFGAYRLLQRSLKPSYTELSRANNDSLKTTFHKIFVCSDSVVTMIRCKILHLTTSRAALRALYTADVPQIDHHPEYRGFLLCLDYGLITLE